MTGSEQPPGRPRPRRRRMRKVGAVLAIVAGLALVAIEWLLMGEEQQGVSWFWIVVAGVLVMLGLAELLDRGEDNLS